MTINGVVFVVLFGSVLSGASYASAGFLSGSVLHRPEITSLVQFASLLILAQAIFQSGVSALLGWSYMGRISVTNVFQAALRLAVAVPLIVLGFAVFGGSGGQFRLGQRRRSPGTGPSPPKERWRRWSSLGRLHLGRPDDAHLRTHALRGSVCNKHLGAVRRGDPGHHRLQHLRRVLPVCKQLRDCHNHYVWGDNPGSLSRLRLPRRDEGRSEPRLRVRNEVHGFRAHPNHLPADGRLGPDHRVPLPSYGVASGYLALLSFANISLLLGHGVLPSFFNGAGRPRFYTIFSLVGAALQFTLALYFP